MRIPAPLPFLLMALLIALFLISLGLRIMRQGRAEEMLEEWANQNKFQIVKYEYRRLFKGPFFWGSSRGQFVYRVTVTDSHGDTRVAWVRLGSWVWGVWKNQVQVIWDETAG